VLLLRIYNSIDAIKNGLNTPKKAATHSLSLNGFIIKREINGIKINNTKGL
jgi:hypothetical protein